MRNTFKTIIKPSPVKVKKHLEAIKIEINKRVVTPGLIMKLNPMIFGWANYFRSGVSAETFSYCDHRILWMILRRLGRLHPSRGLKWIFNRYFKNIKGYKWSFVYQDSENKIMSLARHVTVKIKRHIKVRGEKSPFDNDIVYWLKRGCDKFQVSPALAKKLIEQNGLCKICNGRFTVTDKIELDHITPKIDGGKLSRDNIQAVHKHCHHIKTARENAIRKAGSTEGLRNEIENT